MVGLASSFGGLRVAARTAGQMQKCARLSVTRVCAQGVSKEVVKEGTGAQPTKGQKVSPSPRLRGADA
jgi:FKBP-type peptidyl-prolyl cis-trans isomerase